MHFLINMATPLFSSHLILFKYSSAKGLMLQNKSLTMINLFCVQSHLSTDSKVTQDQNTLLE